MSQLSEHEQQQVDAAANKHCTCGTKNCAQKTSFHAGVAFALDHLFAGRMERFAEWIRTRDGNQKMSLNDHDWYYDADHDGDLPIPDEELIRQFIQERLKKQQEGQPENKTNTMTPLQSIIDRAATLRGGKSAFDIGYYQGFNAGGVFATTSPSALKEILQAFGDWLWRNYKQIDAQVWKERWSTSDTVYTLYQVIEKYLQHLETIKLKEDEDIRNI